MNRSYNTLKSVLLLTTAELIRRTSENETDSIGKFHENIEILLQRIGHGCIQR